MSDMNSPDATTLDRQMAAQDQSLETKQSQAAAIRESVAFSQMIAILSRSPQHKHYTLADIEWLVVPPLITGQFAIAERKTRQDGPSIPLGLVFWAAVSPEVDQRLSNLANPVRLHPGEWKSGDILWLIEGAGDPQAISTIINQFLEGPFKGSNLKLRTADEDGRPITSAIAAKPTA